MKKLWSIAILLASFLAPGCNNSNKGDSERDMEHKNHMEGEQPDTSSLNESRDVN